MGAFHPGKFAFSPHQTDPTIPRATIEREPEFAGAKRDKTPNAAGGLKGVADSEAGIGIASFGRELFVQEPIEHFRPLQSQKGLPCVGLQEPIQDTGPEVGNAHLNEIDVTSRLILNVSLQLGEAARLRGEVVALQVEMFLQADGPHVLAVAGMLPTVGVQFA